ncbi:MAG: SUMF1/EgtB/PvdO family nonheme iron enzyme [Myxococcales bacterium]|nr:SUMF1/EgtB/PvdO family nonheme iron enzyme [Myxococcales bacterium]
MAACEDGAASVESSAASSEPEGPPSGVAPPLVTTMRSEAPPPTEAPPPPPPPPRCPPEMVLVKASYCVDRYEATLVADKSGAALSPYYPPEQKKALFIEKVWKGKRGTGSAVEQSMELPPLPAWQREPFEPRATSRKGVVPQAYASGKDASIACKNAGKRLCTRDEWRQACRGEQDRDFPYGEKYEEGKCNIVRELHPGVVLWEDPTINHTDPRFNLVPGKRGPLLRVTGATPTCASKWGDDAIYDMNGNVDEWIDDPEGTFVGGFYARGKKDGCQSKVENHVFTYADYSTGVRCCRDTL